MKLLLLLAFACAQDKKDKEPATTKEAMQRVQVVVGEWRVLVRNEEVKKDMWNETHEWGFKIDKDEYRLKLSINDGKQFKDGVLSYDLTKKVYRFDATRGDKDGTKIAYEGTLKGKELTLDQVVDKGAKQERLTFTFLHGNRYLASLEKREAGGKAWLMTHSIECTKEGVPFVKNEGPKCVVTGGSGTIGVPHGGQTYYVC